MTRQVPPEPHASYRCTECRGYFDGRPYYMGTITEPLFDGDEEWTSIEYLARLCPGCAGPFVEPDDPGDPRRPVLARDAQGRAVYRA